MQMEKPFSGQIFGDWIYSSCSLYILRCAFLILIFVFFFATHNSRVNSLIFHREQRCIDNYNFKRCWSVHSFFKDIFVLFLSQETEKTNGLSNSPSVLLDSNKIFDFLSQAT